MKMEDIYKMANDMRPYVYLLYNFARESQGDILEIGVRRGQSTMAFLAGLQGTERKLYSIDWATPKEKISGKNWRFIQQDSRTIPEEIKGKKFSILMVDGDHTEEGVRGDWERYKGFARDFVIFHDVSLDWLPAFGRENGVKKLWEELRGEIETLTLNWNKYGLGIGRIK